MVDYLDFEKIEELGAREADVRELPTQVIKLQEECGEVASAFLAFAGTNNASGSSTDKADLYMELMEEVLDVMIVAADIVNKMTDGSDIPDELKKEIVQLTDRKLNKWSSKISNRESKQKIEAYEEFIK